MPTKLQITNFIFKVHPHGFNVIGIARICLLKVSLLVIALLHLHNLCICGIKVLDFICSRLCTCCHLKKMQFLNSLMYRISVE